MDLQLQTGTLHTETIRFYIITSPHNTVILGLPWLHQHNPLISWREDRILKWNPLCHSNCITGSYSLSVQAITLKDEPALLPTLPIEYSDFTEAFSKTKASELPPHRSSDCSIELLPGTAPPKGRIFPHHNPNPKL